MTGSCPHCEFTSESERGMKTHIGRMHDPLPEEKATNLYVYEDLTSAEIAERVNMSHRNVKNRLSEYNLWDKDPCKFTLEDTEGYSAISKTGDKDVKRLRVHRLIAISKGYDPHKVFSGEFDVDHINQCKLDNRPENIQLLNKQDHGAKHAHQGQKNQYDS